MTHSKPGNTLIPNKGWNFTRATGMADINNKDFYSSFSAITEEVIDHNLTTCLLQLLVSYQTKNWHVSEQSKDFGIYAVAQPEPPRQTKELCKRLSRITPAFRLQLNSLRSDKCQNFTHY